MEQIPVVETHPLQPFLPTNTKLLMLGSFPPPQKRWSMNFFYPNFQNDMWRIFGLVFKQDRDAFVDLLARRFKQEALVEFLTDKGVGCYDAACAVRRLQGNASDKFLEIVQPTDVVSLLAQVPTCHALVTTGQKATDVLCQTLGVTPPAVGQGVDFELDGRQMTFFRMPSSSRAYPMRFEQKAERYAEMFKRVGLL